MSDNYTFGSKGLGLKNTFKFDGILYAVNEIISFIIGSCLMYFFSQKALELNLEYSLAKAISWVKTIGGIYLIFLSAYLLMIGLRKFFCDFENSEVPADIIAFDTYDPDQLIKILVKGKIPFKKPDGILEELTNSMFTNFKYIPLPILTITQNIFNGLIQIIFLIFLYYIAIISGFSFNIIVKDWVEYILLFWIISILLKYRPRKNRKLIVIKKKMKIKSLTIIICAAFIIPIILSQINSYGYLPKLPDNGQSLWLSVVIGFTLYSTLIALLFVWLISNNDFSIDVVEFKKKLTAKASPTDIFLRFDDAITDLQYRYKGASWPNRQFLNEPPEVDNNGKFYGRKLII